MTAWADIALSLLAVVMLVLLVLELGDLAPAERRDDIIVAQTSIWAVFVVAFVIELTIAPSKRRYLRTHWLVLLSLALPFLRVFRVARALRFLRATRAVRVVTLGRVLSALNRARGALARFAVVSQFGYLVLLTVFVTVSAASAAFFFERTADDSTIRSFPDALWWASTLITTVGSEAEAQTAEGRVLSLFLRVFGVAVIGYLTARLAVFLLGAPASEVQSSQADRLTEIGQRLDEMDRLMRRMAETRDGEQGQERSEDT